MDTKYHILSRMAATLLIVILTVFVVIQLPSVQTFVASKVLDKLNLKLASIGAEIEVGLVNIQPNGTIIINDASLLDRNPYCDSTNAYGFEPVDTIMHFNSIYASFSLRNLFNDNALFLKKAVVDGATINIICEPCEYRKQIPNINRALGLTPKEFDERNNSDIFEIAKVKLNDIHFNLRNYVRPKPTEQDNCIDWNDFGCVVSTEAEHLSFRKGIMRGMVIDTKAKVKGGYELSHVEGRARAGGGVVYIENVKIIDKWSDIDLPKMVLTFKNAESFQDYNNKVHMSIRPARSLISSRSLQYFCHLDTGSNLLFDLHTGSFEGYVSNAYIRNIYLVERLSNFPLKIHGNILGLGNPGNFAMDLEAESPSFTTSSLEKFIKGFSPESKVGIDRLAKEKNLRFSANAHGRMNSLNVKMMLGGQIGELKAGFNLANINDEDEISVKGTFNLDNVDLGAFLGNQTFGLADARASLRTAFTDEGPVTILDSLKIDRFSIKGYDYSGILAKGKITNEYFNGNVTSTDPNADFNFNGLLYYGYKGEMLHSEYSADIKNFDISKTHFFERWETAAISAKLSADYFASSRTNAVGSCIVDSLILDNGMNIYEFDRIGINTSEENDIYHLLIDSGIATIGITSDITIPEAVKGLCNATLIREIPDILPKLKDTTAKTGNMMLDLKVSDISQVLAFFYPELSVSNGTILRLNTDRDGSTNILFLSDGINFKGKEFNGLDLSFDNLYGSLNAVLTADDVKIGNVQLKDNILSANIDDNNLDASLFFSGNESANIYGELYVNGSARKAEDGSSVFTIIPLPSYIVMRESKWQIEESKIEIGKEDLSISGLTVFNGHQSLKINGGLSSSKSDTLTLALSEFDLASADELTGKSLGIKGIANGNATIYSSENEGRIFLGEINCKGLDIRDNSFGDISLSSLWNQDEQRLDIGLLNKNVGINFISANGSYVPKSKTLTSNVSLENISMKLLSSFAPEAITESGGSVSGNISIDGMDGKFRITTENLTLNNLMVKPTATNVPYTINGFVRLDKDRMDFPELEIKDNAAGSGTISGSILHKSFKDLNFKLNANLRDMTLLDIAENSEKLYGKIAASVQASLTGPLKELNVIADATTSSPGEIHVPLASTITQEQSDLLTFRGLDEGHNPNSNKSSVESALLPKKTDINIRCRISANENLKAFIEIDKENENVIEASGEGTIVAELRPAKKTSNMAGDFNITDGQYHFTALGSLIRKDFTINPGSSIKFGGSIRDTKLDVSTTYSLKTSLSTLIADSTSIASRREVNCGINIGNDIKSPSLSFSINIPDLDPTTKSKVEAALNTEDKVQRQFVSLLLTNSFYPAEQSGVSFNNSNILYSNISSIMSGQVNSILKKLDIPIDLGLSYLKNEVGTNIFDVAVSTQLFHNRVQINGSVGNRQRSTSTGKDIVGNIDIGIKLDKEGKLQVKLFSHSSDDYTKFLDNGQKNGLGISFQKEFKNKKISADSTRTIIVE